MQRLKELLRKLFKDLKIPEENVFELPKVSQLGLAQMDL